MELRDGERVSIHSITRVLNFLTREQPTPSDYVVLAPPYGDCQEQILAIHKCLVHSQINNKATTSLLLPAPICWRMHMLKAPTGPGGGVVSSPNQAG